MTFQEAAFAQLTPINNKHLNLSSQLYNLQHLNLQHHLPEKGLPKRPDQWPIQYLSHPEDFNSLHQTIGSHFERPY